MEIAQVDVGSRRAKVTYHIDREEYIDMCLSCPYPECVNCIGNHRIKERLEATAPRYTPETNRRGVIEHYATSQTDREIGEKIGRSYATVHAIRLSLGLPAPSTVTVAVKRKLVEKLGR